MLQSREIDLARIIAIPINSRAHTVFATRKDQGITCKRNAGFSRLSAFQKEMY